MVAMIAPSASRKPARYARFASEYSFPTALATMHPLYLGPPNTTMRLGLHRFELDYYPHVSMKERRYVFSTPRIGRADIEVPNTAVDMDSWAVPACYPRSNFYPLSFRGV